MNKYFSIIISFITLVSLLMLTGCKYDVAEPGYLTSDFVQPPVKPNINAVQPAAALPGVNTITFSGENIDKVADNKIYWEIPGQIVIQTQIVSKTSTFLTVRRPNLSSDSCVLKLVPDSGLVVKFGPYKIDGVIGQFGSFVDYAVPLSGITVDNAGNIFVVKGGTAPFVTYKVTADGQRSTIADSLPRPQVSSPPQGPPTGIALSPDGHLAFFRGHRHIQWLNTSTGVVTSYHQLKTNRQLRVGTFDSNSNLYAGGNRVGLWVIKPDSTSEERSDLYPTTAGDSIWAMHVYNNYLYMAVG
ncbi:MAG TPA: hypothetical protein VMT35_02680, partial [Ignavibacteriaceae bacterium]|nr:hypothetical protein [Ignavibacteriaceae bacterium]